MNEIHELLNRVTFEGRELDTLPYEAVRRVLDEHHLVRVRGLFDRDEVLAARRNIERRFDPRDDRKHDPRDAEAIRGNFQKLMVGGISPTVSHARFLRMLYNPVFADDIYGMRELFVRLARFRNLLYELPREFAVRGTDNGLWTASRVHQYPRGGGFMIAHRDDITAKVVQEAGFKLYLQVYLVMSKKGEDFHAGGAFLDYQGRPVSYEEACDPGDVLLYNGNTLHGVADIDPLEPLDLTHFTGRVAAFVTLFKHLKPAH